MTDNPRIDDLRRRVQKDPASIAFAQLAEELRRLGRCEEAVDVCHAGLTVHPGYLSARVTLGRALLELNQLEAAFEELEQVLKSAPENLAAIRGLAEIFHRRGELALALQQYRNALALAKNDPDLQQTVAELAKQVEPHKPRDAGEGLSLEQMQDELFKVLPPLPPKPVPPEPAPAPAIQESVSAPGPVEERSGQEPVPEPSEPERHDVVTRADEPVLRADAQSAATVESDQAADHARAQQTIATLERWLDAIHVSRTQSDP